MSFNNTLRKFVYGHASAARTNPLLHLPAGFTGTTWHGTGFENPPTEQIELDPQTLPWELTDAPAPTHAAPAVSQPVTRIRGFSGDIWFSLAVMLIVIVGIVFGFCTSF